MQKRQHLLYQGEERRKEKKKKFYPDLPAVLSRRSLGMYRVPGTEIIRLRMFQDSSSTSGLSARYRFSCGTSMYGVDCHFATSCPFNIGWGHDSDGYLRSHH
jgi:hypothetical protein